MRFSQLTSLFFALFLLALSGCTVGFWDQNPESLAIGDDDDDAADDDDAGDDDTDVADDEDVANDDDSNSSGDDDDLPPGDDDDAADDDDDGGTDVDGDGYAAGEDCDDYNASVYPDAEDVPCDGLDNDCDGLFPSEDLDADGDGYSSCLGDCDDLDPNVGSGFSEVICDGIDQDCDGVDACDDPEDPIEDPEDPIEDPEDPEDPTDPVGGGEEGNPCETAAYLGSAGAATTSGDLDATDYIYGGGGGWIYEAWTVDIPSAGLWYVDLLSSDFDAYVELYDSACGFIGFDDDGYLPFFSTDSSYSYTGIGGETIIVVATSYSEQETGSYFLDVW